MNAFSRGKIADLLHAVKPPRVVEVPEASRITVHAAVSRFSMLYEKVRNAIDYKDDHLLRKAAIVRILKRQLVLETDADTIGQQVVREMIAARYLPNGVLPESLYQEVACLVKKYQALKHANVGSEKHERWILGVVASEIEESLNHHEQEKAFVHFLYEQIADRITVRGWELDESTRRLQIYIAVLRSLTKADEEMLAYKLVRTFQPAWLQPERWIDDAYGMAQAMVKTHKDIQETLNHSLSQKFLQAVKPWAISLTILRDALQERVEDAPKLLDHSEELFVMVERIAERRYKESRDKLRRGTIRAIIYLFITKMVFAMAIEIPFELLFYREVHMLGLIVNITFPPFLMLLVGSMIRLPGKDNVNKIKKGVEELLSIDGPKGFEIRVASSRKGLGGFMFSVVYALTFLLTFGLIYGMLHSLSFTWVSSVIFIFFLCIVSFFAFRLRMSAREYVVVSRAERFSTALMDFFSLPILRAGQWLSRSISRVNIFIFLFDFIIEAPFKIFLNVMEEWFAYMKEKREELQ